ncbi:alpha-E domain-containing protein [Methyloglobulus sp.]|uniref:alpha-E domain-containing protein n=1 Tax=Methyloglobulus sp. TaxID=2518622 RepID=UPI0032B765E8
MLSRSAERLYWLGRYLERTENTARLLSVHMNLMFDLPMSVEISWRNLLTIFEAGERFFQLYETPDERNTMRFLLADTKYYGSLFSSLNFARENIRTSRDLVPDEAWQQVNEMYLLIREKSDSVVNRSERVVLLNEIMRGCQRFTGFLSGAMSQDDAYRFIQLGRNIERADMTTRILDIGSTLLAEDRSDKMREYENTLWMNVLKSLSALLMYRKHRRHRINSGDVLDYLIKDANFPRSVRHCIDEVESCIRCFPHSEGLFENISIVRKMLKMTDYHQITPTNLHALLDSIQVKLDEIHQQIAGTWFLAGNQAC